MKKDRARIATMRKQRSEDLLETARQAMEDIRRAYRIYRKKRPIIESAVDENLIYAYPGVKMTRFPARRSSSANLNHAARNGALRRFP
jgi:hypothetical protein